MMPWLLCPGDTLYAAEVPRVDRDREARGLRGGGHASTDTAPSPKCLGRLALPLHRACWFGTPCFACYDNPTCHQCTHVAFPAPLLMLGPVRPNWPLSSSLDLLA